MYGPDLMSASGTEQRSHEMVHPGHKIPRRLRYLIPANRPNRNQQNRHDDDGYEGLHECAQHAQDDEDDEGEADPGGDGGAPNVVTSNLLASGYVVITSVRTA